LLGRYKSRASPKLVVIAPSLPGPKTLPPDLWGEHTIWAPHQSVLGAWKVAPDLLELDQPLVEPSKQVGRASGRFPRTVLDPLPASEVVDRPMRKLGEGRLFMHCPVHLLLEIRPLVPAHGRRVAHGVPRSVEAALGRAPSGDGGLKAALTVSRPVSLSGPPRDIAGLGHSVEMAQAPSPPAPYSVTVTVMWADWSNSGSVPPGGAGVEHRDSERTTTL
jgi:hypothetical protein